LGRPCQSGKVFPLFELPKIDEACVQFKILTEPGLLHSLTWSFVLGPGNL